jgi:hypothetical protein
MNLVSRIITGSTMMLAGLGLIAVSFKVQYISLFYGIPLFIIGFFILLNRNEDEIEERKDLNKKADEK